MKRLPDFEPCAGDGLTGGDYLEVRLLGALTEFFGDPINLQRAKEAAALHAPLEDQSLLDEVIENIQAGLMPEHDELITALGYCGVFSGLTIRPKQRRITNDTGFTDDEPWQ